MSEPGLIAQIDQAIGSFFEQWNLASTILAGFLLIVLVYPIFVAKDPDTHPFLLARQAQASPIRQQGESAVYRSTDIPYGYPLRSGLHIKDPGASKWTAGRDGDLRDVWRAAVTGPPKEDGTHAPSTAKITTILGTEKVIEHDLKTLTLDINTVGKHIKDAGGRKVAVCLSNSVELLCTVFAGAFFGFSPILVPYAQEPDTTINILGTTEFDTLVAEVGSVALEKLLSKNSSIRRIIWVAKEGSKHLDWSETPKGYEGKLEVVTWHNLIDDKKAGSSSEVLPLDTDSEVLPVLAFWPNKDSKYKLIEYTQKNLLSGTAALLASLPRLHKLSNTDSILLATPLTTTYTLCFALLTLFSGSTLLLNSVAGPNIKLLNATKSAHQKLKPTHITADARAIPRFLEDLLALPGASSFSARYTTWSTGRTISQGWLNTSASKSSHLPPYLQALKTLYIAQPDHIPLDARVHSSTLARFRLLLGARVSLALTSGRVAGFVAQSNILDYRDKGSKNCVGAVAASLELCLVGAEAQMAKQDGVGEIAVRGPSVVGREGEKEKTTLEGVTGLVDVDNTVVLVQA